MKYIEIITIPNNFEEVLKIAQAVNAEDLRYEPEDSDGMQLFRMIIIDEKVQDVLDSFSYIIKEYPNSKLLVIPIEKYISS